MRAWALGWGRGYDGNWDGVWLRTQGTCGHRGLLCVCLCYPVVTP